MERTEMHKLRNSRKEDSNSILPLSYHGPRHVMVELGDYKKQYVRVEADKSSQINTSTVIFKSTSNEYFTIEVLV